MIFGQLAVSRKLVSTAQIQAALSEQREMTEQVPIGEVLVRRGCLTERQRLVILEAQRQLQRGSKRCVVVDERGMTEGCRFGPYDNLREISRGGMGIVYRAEHLNLRRTVALKTLSPEFSERAELVKRFVREAQALAQMAHPNIVQIHNVGLNKGIYFLEMEFVEGVNLQDYLKSHGPLPLTEALDKIIPLATALQAAHQQGIVHRDVKPENIMLAGDGQIKLTDFGAVKYERGRKKIKQTLVGEVLGTPYYMAPEQAQDSSSIDFRVDIYSLGATFFQLVTDRLPFEGNSVLEVLGKHQRWPLPELGELPVKLDEQAYQVICYMMQKSRRNRPASWAEVIRLLDTLHAEARCPSCNERRGSVDTSSVGGGTDRVEDIQQSESSGSDIPQVGSPRPSRVSSSSRASGRLRMAQSGTARVRRGPSDRRRRSRKGRRPIR